MKTIVKIKKEEEKESTNVGNRILYQYASVTSHLQHTWRCIDKKKNIFKNKNIYFQKHPDGISLDY